MSDDVDIRALLGPIRRQFRLIVTIFLLVVSAVAVVSFSLTPKFQATALLYVDTGYRSLLNDNANPSSSSIDHSKVTSEVEIIKSDGVILNLIEQLDLVTDDEFGVELSQFDKLMAAFGLLEVELPSGSNALASVITNVQEAIDVQRRGLTYIISISATSENPEKAATLANELSKSYIEGQLGSKISNVEISLSAVQKQITENETKVFATQKILDEFIADNLNKIAKTNSQTDFVELQSKLINLRQQRLTADIEKSWILKGLGGGELTSEFSDLKSEALRELKSQRDQIARRISEESSDSVSLTDLRNQLSLIEVEFKNKAALTLEGINRTISEVDSSISELRNELNSRIFSGDIELPDDLSAQLYRLSQQNKNTNAQYQRLLAKAQELEAESLLQIADSRVISAALPPGKPVSPNLIVIILAASIIALGLALAVAFIIENYDGGFTSADQIEEVLGLSLASTIRTLPGNNLKSISEFVINKPLSIFSESFRTLRTSIEIATQNLPTNAGSSGEHGNVGKVIMVSSAAAGEGKSSISLSLARTLASSGSKTLIIDCDVRKPTIASHLNSPSGKSLTNLLFKGEITPQSVTDNIAIDHMTNLHAILAYKDELDDVQLMLRFLPFESIIEAAKQEYDFVILDTPPIGPVADALKLAVYSDVILFVIRWAKTSQRVILQSLKRIDAMVPDTPTLAVLNQVDAHSDGASSYEYGHVSSQRFLSRVLQSLKRE